jgi:hypothetical protein
VVEYVHPAKHGVALLGRNPNELVELGLREWRVSAQGHHEVETASIVEDLDQEAEQLRERGRAGVIGDQDEDTLTREATCEARIEGLPKEGGFENTIGRRDAGGEIHGF